MKFTFATITVALFVVCLGSTVFSQRLGCSYPTNTDNRGIYYMSCFNRLSGEPTDYERIQFAVNYIPGGKIIFDKTPDGNPYTVSQAVVLKSFLILEGTGTGTTIVPSSSAIKLTTSGTSTNPKSIFKIGENVFDVTIRDLGLLAASGTSYTAGILAEGTHSSTSTSASLNFEFNNIRFTGFTTGIKVNALDSQYSWQFDNVKLEHCNFQACKTGVHINSFNSGWQMNSIEFFAGANALGVYIERGTYSTIDSMIGNGLKPAQSDTFIKIKEIVAPLTIRNCVSEEFANDLIVDAPTGSITKNITLTANVFQGLVNVKNADILSTGNQFGLTVVSDGIVYIAPQPIASGVSRITSIGDRFCSDGGTNCATGGYQLVDNAFIVFSSNLNNNIINRPTYVANFLDITTNLPFDVNKPLLNLNRPTYNNFPLLRLGTGSYYYTLSRDNNGFLKFQGNQNPLPPPEDPNALYKGYNFDGPVKLPEFIATSLPNILENGSMVFCSNCQAGTSPCAAGTGGGALAISISGKWACK